VPAWVITRSPDAVSVTPGGKPVFVASGHPPAGVVVAKIDLLYGFSSDWRSDPRSTSIVPEHGVSSTRTALGEFEMVDGGRLF
jgi:hypothetical protein